MHRLQAFILSAILTTATVNADIRVNTRFEPSRIAIGSQSKYIVEIIETDAHTIPSTERITSLPIASAGGLTLRNGQISTSQSIRTINAQSQHSITQQLILDAIPPKTGSFTIPAYRFEYKNKELQVPAATLKVVKRAADAVPTIDELIFLQTDAPAQLYVGQTTAITLKLYLSNQVQLRGIENFERTADGFTVSPLPKQYTENVETVNGRRYRVYSWPLTITPISAGTQDLEFHFTLTAQMPNQGSRRGSPFGGSSIFDDFFGRYERFNLYTKPTQINVRSLPAEGQPQSFSGAIGAFNMEVSADTESTRVNEPIMLSLKLSGHGNFERIKGPALPAAEGWRHYPPESAFEPKDPHTLKGVKRFDYVCVPEKSGTLQLPEITFSFFDPQTEQYVELSSPALGVNVAPSERSPLAPVPPAPRTEEPTVSLELSKTLDPEALLLTLDYRPKTVRTLPLTPMVSPLLYGLNAAALLVLTLSGIWIHHHRRLRQSADYALVQQARKALRIALKECRSNDAATFYRSAQAAIRLAATARSKYNLRSADWAELEPRLRQIGLSANIIEQAHALFQAADHYRFSQQRQTEDLSSARTQLQTILHSL